MKDEHMGVGIGVLGCMCRKGGSGSGGGGRGASESWVASSGGKEGGEGAVLSSRVWSEVGYWFSVVNWGVKPRR